jgi:beta-glucanase (GH16 family)
VGELLKHLKRPVLSLAAATTVFLAAIVNARVPETRAATRACVVQNGGFEDNLDGAWQLQMSGAGGVQSTLDVVEGRASNRAVRITTDGPHANPWDLQLAQPGVTFEPGQRYTLSFWARMSQSQQIDVIVQSDGGDYAALWSRAFTVFDAWNRYEASFVYPVEAGARSNLVIDLGRVIGPIWIDDIALCETGEPLSTPTPPAQREACRVINGSFETDNIDPWAFTVSSGAARLEGDYGARDAQAARIVIERTGANPAAIRLTQDDLPVDGGRWMYLDLYARATQATGFVAALDNNAGARIWRADIRMPDAEIPERYLHIVYPIYVADATRATLSLNFGSSRGAITIDAIQLCDAPATFADEFNGAQLDLGVWQHCKAYLGDCTSEDANASVEWWSAANATVADGALRMAFTRDPRSVCIDCSFREIRYVDREFAGVLIQTGNTVKLRSGYIEARIKTPPTPGLWPAFWLMPALSPKGDVVWPPEIDVLEQFTIDKQETFHTLHYPAEPSNGKDGRTIQHPFVVSDEYHVYAINWTAEEIVWYVDGVEAHRTRAYGVDIPMYMILSVGSGGPAGQPDGDLSQATTYVDYVRVYDNAPLNGIVVQPPEATIDFSTLTERVFLPLARRR